ncbi:MAG: Lrp/AsnC family transcriptional regulator [Clostridia bacterium]|nr:Lrp/AsnC family transcriptional regulator [Clostridia bacterium]
MNELKKQLINYLSEDSRYTYKQLAMMTGATSEQVETAIKELESEKVILKYSTVVNTDKYESGSVDALIQVSVKPQKLKGFDALAEELCAFEEVQSLYLISGGFDLCVIVKAKDLASVARFVSEKLSGIDGVISVSSHFILKKYKIEGQATTSPSSDRQIVL